MLTTLITKDEVLKMAEQCGLPEFENNESQAVNLVMFAKLVDAKATAREREACAKVVEPSAEHRANPSDYIAEEQGIELLDGIAAKIRARGGEAT